MNNLYNNKMRTIKEFIKRIDSVDIILITGMLLYVIFIISAVLRITQ